MSVSVIELDDDGEPTFELDPFSYGIAEEAKLKDSFAPSGLKADTQYEVRIEFYFNDDIDLNVYLGAEHGLTVRTRAVSTATPGLAGQIEQIATPASCKCSWTINRVTSSVCSTCGSVCVVRREHVTVRGGRIACFVQSC